MSLRIFHQRTNLRTYLSISPHAPAFEGHPWGTTSPVLLGMHSCLRSGLLLDFGTSEKPQNRKGKTQRATEMRLDGYEVRACKNLPAAATAEIRGEAARVWAGSPSASDRSILSQIQPFHATPTRDPSNILALERWQSSNMPSHTQVTDHCTKLHVRERGEALWSVRVKRVFFLTETADGSGIPEFVVVVLVTFRWTIGAWKNLFKTSSFSR